jgi:hypothetical protein
VWPMTSKVFKAQRFAYCDVHHIMVQPWAMNVSIYLENIRVIYFSLPTTIKHGWQKITLHLLWCSSHYGTAVEHRSLLNQSGICDGIICCNIFVVHTAVLSIKTAFNLVKIHLLFRIILMKLYWFRNLVQYFLSWNMMRHIF